MFNDAISIGERELDDDIVFIDSSVDCLQQLMSRAVVADVLETSAISESLSLFVVLPTTPSVKKGRRKRDDY